ncbi:ATP-binding protein [Paraburkholderia hospita]|uniref:ATP-binding protein n=1 Tax=Paraburkholderia hospita TaxID=169430 RepID=UPI0008A7775D|nr:ATP-binding protein [Paraburkholderia hospita]SEI14864.1 Histidine kinase-, DNA gyrase B-, and HSP90-like ATPase [Paraburkholderia hospita]
MRLPFELDPAIIHHIIYSQAGSIGKAIIELIMNSVDADARSVVLTMSKDGFSCKDDGRGFATREDVLRYFGRFGTPHQEGDATYGRFRLGRGQIMAHASTVWRSNLWQMNVDTRSMGYSYDLDDLANADRVQGCDISGEWYEPLTDTELLSATQEIRDLVRYTPVSVELNGRAISRDPRSEKWDHEDICVVSRQGRGRCFHL